MKSIVDVSEWRTVRAMADQDDITEANLTFVTQDLADRDKYLKDRVDGHIADVTGNVHGATVSDTANMLVRRDGTGFIQTKAAVADVNPVIKGQFTSLKAANGYQKLPSGITMQWGKITGVSLYQTFHSIVFPVTFDTECLNVSVTVGMDAFGDGGTSPILKKTSMTRSGCQIGADQSHTGVVLSGDLFWFAVGY